MLERNVVEPLQEAVLNSVPVPGTCVPPPYLTFEDQLQRLVDKSILWSARPLSVAFFPGQFSGVLQQHTIWSQLKSC